MQQSQINLQQTFLFVNQHNKGAGQMPSDAQVPKSFRDIDKAIGTAEDSTFCVQGFERYFSKLLRELNEQKKADEDQALQ